METISNETKAKEICHCSECTYKIKSEGDNCMCPRMAAILQAMEWKDEQFAQERQALIQKYEDKLNKLNQREETIRDNVRRANSRYGFEGLF